MLFFQLLNNFPAGTIYIYGSILKVNQDVLSSSMIYIKKY